MGVASDPVYDETTVSYFVSCLAVLLLGAEAARAVVAHKQRPGVCCPHDLLGLKGVRLPGGCSFVSRLEAAGLVVKEDHSFDRSSAISDGRELRCHPFVSVLQVA